MFRQYDVCKFGWLGKRCVTCESVFMTTVNWHRESGDRVEEFVAAMILLDNPQGNRITPSKGDGGIDIQVETKGRTDIYQVKKFASTLTSSQKTQVENSFKRFVSATLPGRAVRSWKLLMPWDPTREQLEWFQQLTKGYDFKCDWWGLSHLDGLAAKHPHVVDYYFGDGGNEVKRLMADVLDLRRDVSREHSDEDLTQRLIDRQQQITKALTENDPFYKYVVDIRSGDARSLEEDLRQKDNMGAAYVSYLQLSDEQYAITRVLPLSAESAWLRPITGKLSFKPALGSAEHAALKDFLDYGIPFSGVHGELSNVVGPPGTVQSGSGTFSVSATSGEIDPIELQLRHPGTNVIHRLALSRVRVTEGPSGSGLAMNSTDSSGSLDVVFKSLVSDGKCKESLGIQLKSLVGRYPRDVQETVRFVAHLNGENELTLGTAGGPALSSPWLYDGGKESEFAKAILEPLDSLMIVQQHTHVQIRIPDLKDCTEEEFDSWGLAARILTGEKVEGSWDRIRLSPINPINPDFSNNGTWKLVRQQNLFILIEGRRIDLNARMQAIYAGGKLSFDFEGPVLVALEVGSATLQTIDVGGAGVEGLDHGSVDTLVIEESATDTLDQL